MDDQIYDTNQRSKSCLKHKRPYHIECTIMASPRLMRLFLLKYVRPTTEAVLLTDCDISHCQANKLQIFGSIKEVLLILHIQVSQSLFLNTAKQLDHEL